MLGQPPWTARGNKPETQQLQPDGEENEDDEGRRRSSSSAIAVATFCRSIGRARGAPLVEWQRQRSLTRSLAHAHALRQSKPFLMEPLRSLCLSLNPVLDLPRSTFWNCPEVLPLWY
ncbi:uncharacterized protein [Physcomitrium patens]|uniref:uncharacterized protein n=1 Tax=Physcomitrium patens TaxID=3218 RepID=UPI003CCE2783